MTIAWFKGLTVPIEIKQEVIYYNKKGTLTTTVSLVTQQDLEHHLKLLGKQSANKSEPISAILRRGETHVTIPNRFSSEVMNIPLSELLLDYKDQKLEELFLFIQNRFRPDADETPLYLSDMIDEYRRLGVPESTIQELLNKGNERNT